MPSRPTSTAYLRAAEELRDNPEQWAAYESAGNCVMLAGPGSGKTKTLVLKLARILSEDVQAPRGVACITFSQEAARELTRRLGELGLNESSRLFVGTVHSFCLLHLLIPFAGLAGLNVPQPIKVAPLSVANELFAREAERSFGSNSAMRRRKHEIDLVRRQFLDRTSVDWGRIGDDSRMADAYEAALRAEGYLDFEDLVHFGQRLVLENDWVLAVVRARFPVLAVDEYQDLGVGLDRIVQRLAFDGAVRLLAVGDVDQAVYGFNGARSELLEQLAAQDEVEDIRLKINYRSAQGIISAAERALGQARGYRAVDKTREARVETTHCRGGLSDQATVAMAEIIPRVLAARPGRQLGDVAVLYRTAAVGDVAAEAATAAGYGFIRIDNAAPYRKTSLTSWVEDCAAWCSGGWMATKPMLRDLLNRWVAFRRSRLTPVVERQYREALTRFLWAQRECNEAKVFLRELRVALLDELLATQPELTDQGTAVESMTRSLARGGALEGISTRRLGGRDGASDQLNLLTLHSAKGTEYDVVIMLGMDQGSFPWRNEGPEQLAESRRLFYVGLTRAKDEVFLLYSGFTEWNGRRFHNGPSVFLDGLLAD